MGTAGINARQVNTREGQGAAAGSTGERLSIEDLGEVPMHLDVVLGAAQLTVREVLSMKAGTVVPLRKLAGEMSDVYVNGLPLARAEVVVIGDSLSIRIAEIVGQTDRD